MRPIYKDIRAYLAILLLISIPLVLMFPRYTGRFDRMDDLHYDETNVGGMKVSNLREGDTIDIRYNSSSDIGIYLLTSDQADEFRSVKFDKEPLPEAVYTGFEGDLKIDILADGDYEIILWNSSLPGTGGEVDYSGKVHRQRDVTISIVTAISFLMISSILAILLIIQRVRSTRGPKSDA